MTDGNINKHIEVIKQFILQSDKNIDEIGLWQSFLQIVAYIEAIEKANTGCKSQAKPACDYNRHDVVCRHKNIQPAAKPAPDFRCMDCGEKFITNVAP